MKLSLENLYAVVHVYTKFQENTFGHCIDMGEIATFLAFDLDLLTFDLEHVHPKVDRHNFTP